MAEEVEFLSPAGAGAQDVILPPGMELTPGSKAIHTSDRNLYKRCRRKWAWASNLRQGLQPKGDQPVVLWFGSGFHWAMEDYHGYKRFETPQDAFQAYFNAFQSSQLPSGAEEHLIIGREMISHYLNWLRRRDVFRTLWIDGVPQVEVRFAIPLADGIHYAGTFDRIVTDEHGRYWILDYKTAAKFDTSKLEMDPQVSAYCWAAELLYPGITFEGMVYQQHLKAFPKPPRQLVNGGFSVAKNQNTTYHLFKRALMEAGITTVQGTYLEYLNYLATQETPDSDKFIRRDLVRRNASQKEAVYHQIMAEAREMVDPDLPLYPNPTRDCVWDCPFRAPCVATDDGSDPEYLLQENYATRRELGESWKVRMESQLAQKADNEHTDSEAPGSWITT